MCFRRVERALESLDGTSGSDLELSASSGCSKTTLMILHPQCPISSGVFSLSYRFDEFN